MATLTPRKVSRQAVDRASGPHLRKIPDRGWMFYLPFAVVALLFLVIPTLWGFGLSFTERSLMGRGGFVGLANYAEAFGDAEMWRTLGNTLLFTGLSTVPLVVLPLIMAVLVYLGLPGQWLYRFAFFAPFLLPVTVVVQVWGWLFQPDFGFINFWLDRLGLEKIGWLTDSSMAMLSIVIITTWWTVGFNFLLYLSALQSIPDQLLEAGSIDGAGTWRTLWSLILPQLRGTTVLVTILQVLASMKVFDQMFIVYNGGAGPSGSTRPILQYIYDSGFVDYRVGYAAAMSYIFFAIIIVATLVIQGVQRYATRGARTHG
ncbi:sugar ABC transporter permease [Micrococcales bacterium 31B]|nr:sugar ABC transporter permease [Micrococcales bacterium 31B]